MRQLFCLLCLGADFLVPSFDLAACPQIISAAETMAGPVGVYSIKTPGSTWSQVGHQFQWYDEDGQPLHEFSIADQQALPNPDYRTSRKTFEIVVDSQGWGQRWDGKGNLPCSASTMREYSNLNGGYLYVGTCTVDSIKESSQKLLSLDLKARKVKSDEFEFNYDRRNHLLFRRLNLISPSRVLETVASHADLRIYSDVKSFFDLDFGVADIESLFSSYQNGSQMLAANLTFFLRILFFKIDLKLTTHIQFSKNRVYIPMIMHMPVNGPKWLNAGSGLVYSWIFHQDKKFLRTEGLPVFNASAIKAGGSQMAALNRPFCLDKARTCEFKLIAHGGEQPFSMKMHIPQQMAAKGFFPQYVPDLQKLQADLDWKQSDSRENQRVGVYFESSGLEKGEHEWAFELQMGSEASDQEACWQRYDVYREVKGSASLRVH